MTGFWISAVLLSLAATGFVLYPAWRGYKASGQWSVVGLVAAAVTIPVALMLYVSVSNWDSDAVVEAKAGEDSLAPVAELIEGLAERLRENPDDVAGWQLLGQSYMALGQYTEARDALREVWTRTSAPDDELKLALAEAEALSDRRTLSGEAGRLFDEVLASQPMNPKALWYGGLAALETQRGDLMRERWTQLLSLNPPEQVAEVIRGQLGRTPGIPTQMGSTAAVADGSGASITLRVSLSDELSNSSNLGPQSSLFIFARAPEGGPPLAVIRQSATTLPGEFSLSDADAMIPGRSLADFDQLNLVARLSISGQPTEQPGDLYGELVYQFDHDADAVDLLIDRIVE